MFDIKIPKNKYSIFGTNNLDVKNERDSRRTFTRTQKNEIWAQQDGMCAGSGCHKKLDPRTVEYDHGKEWSAGGRTTIKNGRALCADCHKLKTHKDRLKKVDKKRESKSSNKGYSLSGSSGIFGSKPLSSNNIIFGNNFNSGIDPISGKKIGKGKKIRLI